MGNLQPGDVVVLKSGGPLMTVTEVIDSGYVACQWFDEKKVCTGAFLPVTLEKDDRY